MAISQPLSPSRAIMSDLIVDVPLEVGSSSHSLPSEESMHLAHSCKKKVIRESFLGKHHITYFETSSVV